MYFFPALEVGNVFVNARQLLCECLWRHRFAISSVYVTRTPAGMHASSLWTTSWKSRVVLSAPCCEDIWCPRVSVLASGGILSRQFCSTYFHGCPTVEVRCFGTCDRIALTESRDGALFHTSFVPRVIRWWRTATSQFPIDFSLTEILSNSDSSTLTEHNRPPCCEDVGDSWWCRLNVASFAAHALVGTRLAFGCRALGTVTKRVVRSP